MNMKKPIEQDELNSLLVELSSTRYWDAILQYTHSIDSDNIAAVLAVDPFKEPTIVARSQGKRLGIYDLINYVGAINESRKAAANSTNKNSKGSKKDEPVEFNGYNM